ncbi:hypothetical protein BDW59DRAFT_165534 [Aspergillus cavernicola]|uniref:G domain-containing protein n=1 Tax=Aspergillus cavernicola TaxID=176166 RepID=A0ABR4HTK6_9EURO
MTDPNVFEEQVSNILKFTGATRAENDAIFILVLGATGSGKSSFISQCSRKPVEVGHDLSSCTSDLTITSFPYYSSNSNPPRSHTIYLIDTPGFNDTNRPDSDTLTHICHYLSISYVNRIYISGIILMHSIADSRLSRTTKLNVEMAKQIVGDTAYENVAIITSMWSTPPTDRQIQRESELLIQPDGVLADVVKGGGREFRYSSVSDDVLLLLLLGATSSHLRLPLLVIDHLVRQARAGGVVLKVQSELVDDNRKLIDTSAGRYLADRQVLEVREEYEAAMQAIRNVFPNPSHDSLKYQGPLLDVQRTEMETEFANLEKKLQENHASLSKTLVQMHQNEERRLQTRMIQIETDLNTRLDEKQQRLESLHHHRQSSTSIELEIIQLRNEIQELRLEIQQKYTINSSVRQSFRKGLLHEAARGVIGGAVSAAVPVLVAGSLCSLM